MTTALERWVPGLMGLSLIGAPTMYLLYLAVMSRASRGWPVAKGRVTTSQVRTGKKGAADYDVRYRYSVDGQEYSGTRVRWGGALNSNSGDAHATRSTYPEGREVDVRHHPLRPSLSTLETRASRAIWLWLAIGLFISGSIAGALAGFWE
jgi:hypothetical protein